MAEANGQTKPPVIRLEKLTKRFPGVLALDNVDLELYEQEIVGVIGENGAGKSTLLTILTGAQPPSSGQIFLYANSPTPFAASKMRWPKA